MENTTQKVSIPLILALALFTILFAQQLINYLFPLEGDIRTIAKMILDISLVMGGLFIERKTVATALLIAGIMRLLLIFFQLSGMNPAVRVVIILLTLILFIFVGIKKFNINLSGQPEGSKNE